MRDDIRDLITGNNHCVLATVCGTRPHCSLMSYVADEQCHELYMITFRQSQKYTNLLNNPSVSLLIDTREQDTGNKRSRARALTISGVFRNIHDRAKKESVRSRLIARHPHLKELASHPDAEPFSVMVDSVLLLEGVTEAYFEQE